MEHIMKSSTKKIVSVSALGALTLVELIQMQQAQATPVTFTGSLRPDGGFGGNVQVAITVDGASGIYKITNITTPVQPTGPNAAYAAFAIPTLTSEALTAQSASITGVSGASSISAAWIQSLASAIANAAAAGERIGASLTAGVPTPTPTPTVTPPAPTPTPKPTIGAVDPIAGVLAKLVLAGTITQAQSDAILAALKAAHVSQPQLPKGDDASEGSDDSERGSSFLKSKTSSTTGTHLGGTKLTKTHRVKSGHRG